MCTFCLKNRVTGRPPRFFAGCNADAKKGLKANVGPRGPYPYLPNQEIVRRMGDRSACTVVRYAVKAGLKKLSPNNRYIIDHQRFQSMDPESAYAIGFNVLRDLFIGRSSSIELARIRPRVWDLRSDWRARS
jgi:hypothetical protein